MKFFEISPGFYAWQINLLSQAVSTAVIYQYLQILNDKYKKEEWTYYMIFLDIRPEKDINNDICTT